MKAAHRGEAARVAGRVQEQELLRAAIGGSVHGAPCTVLVHGEAGVGKTRLVQALTEQAGAAGHTVLWGRCLRFGATSSPFLPFVSAFDGWLDEGHDGEGLDLGALYGGGGAAEVLPRAVHVIDRVLTRLAAEAPLILVLDDLQWADMSSLDALAYLIAGMRRQRLAVLVTYRDVGLPDGHPLHAWVADMLRMPGVHDVPLGRLTEEETADQLADLLGGAPRPALVRAVWDRSGGNPYLTELLAGGLDPAATVLPDDIPEALRLALLAHWHGLSPSARQVTQVLAVAGRPVDPRVLGAVVGGGDVARALHEATEAGVAQQDRSGRVWFRHPLLSDVLYATLLPGEGRDLHRAFVAVLVEGDARGVSPGDLALHYAGADMFDEAFEKCLEAAEEAGAVQAYPEAAVLLRQAVALWPDVTPEVRDRHGSLVALLAESARCCRLTGDLEGALEQLDAAVPLLDEEGDPVTASRVIRMHGQIGYTSGLSTEQPLETARRAVGISAAAPDSDEHAFALADLSDAEMWRGLRDQALEHARAAVEAARRSGDKAALSYALGTLANARADEDDAEQLAREALDLAVEAGRPEYVGLAAIPLANALDTRGRFVEAADVLAEAHARGHGLGGLGGLLGTYAATAMLPLGRLEQARAVLRDVLASRPGGILGIQARECAVVVAVRTGDMDEAAWHLARLRELADNFEDFAGLHGPGVHAEYLLAAGRPREALALLERTLEAHTAAEPKYGDSLLLWAARAAAALPSGERAPALDAVLAVRQRCAVPPFEGQERDPGQRAVRALFEAEAARCRGEPDLVHRWQAAVPLADAAGLRYVAADARLRLAEALLAVRNRVDAARLLREAHGMAVEMGARRLRAEVATVAEAARLSVLATVPVRSEANGHGLTHREREVLAHLVAGRSYSEIASALFISEKTVSVHVSNLLRKTGTANRVEAAAWARRSGAVPSDDAPPRG